jgi:aspartate aminotransferase
VFLLSHEPYRRLGDPERIWNRLADRDLFVMPGSLMRTPDYFRISLTASDTMIDRALPAFEQAMRGDVA